MEKENRSAVGSMKHLFCVGRGNKIMIILVNFWANCRVLVEFGAKGEKQQSPVISRLEGKSWLYDHIRHEEGLIILAIFSTFAY